jgi:hypothetical protein
MKTYLFVACLALAFAACDTRVNVPPAERNTTIVNPPAEKKESNTTIVNPPAEKKTETNTTTTTGGGGTSTTTTETKR